VRGERAFAKRSLSVKCPFCAFEESKVTDSRASAASDVIRRRRECEKCARRFTTYERVEETLPMVVKKDGRRELFDRKKVLSGVMRACEKRLVTLAAMDALVDGIERELVESQEKEVRGERIGELVMARLRSLDEIAYVRFASVYRSFRDVAEFRAELDLLASEKPVTTPPKAALSPENGANKATESDKVEGR
jgi:transcriptional repressor NrdR